MTRFIAAAVILAFIIIGKFGDTKSTENVALLKRAEAAAQAIPAKLQSNREQKGEVTYAYDGYVLTERAMQESIRSQTRFEHQLARPLGWLDSSGQHATMTAFGFDYLHHFANSFLVGIRPFEAENDWLPLYVLAQRKAYQYDEKQYGYDDLWQNSAQAFKNLRGDCEDHAIALADWLISEGLDARVALGTYEGGGHAWVVVFKDSQVFLLEATAKRVGKSWNHYPLASLAKGYQVKYMFNRTHYWRHNGGYTQDYQSDKWALSSTFKSYRTPAS